MIIVDGESVASDVDMQHPTNEGAIDHGDVHVVDDHVVGVVDATEKGEVHDQGGLVMVLFFMWRLNIIWQMRM